MFKSTFSLVACATLVASLEANTLQLEPIVISASKTEQSLKDITANVDVITAEEIEERHYSSVIEALNSLPGISFTQSGGVGQQSSLYLRGFSNKYTLVLVDGMRVNDPTNFDGALFDQLMISDIERIEVLKGAQSGIWGADADAGVINIITKKAQPHHLNAYAETGSYNTKKFGATLSHLFNQGDIKFGFDRVLTDGFSAAEPNQSNILYGSRFDDLGWERDPYSTTTLHIKAGLNFSEQDRLEFSQRYVSSHLEYDNAGVDNLSNNNEFTQRFSKASFTHTSNDNIVQLYAGRSSFERSYYNGYKGYTDEAGVINTWNYGKNGSLIGGVSWQNFDVDSAAGSTIAQNYTARAAFVSNSNRFNEGDTVFNQTLRYDDYSIFGSKTTAKLGLKQMIGDALLSSNYGSAYQAPSLIQIFNPYGASNQNLKPENIRSFDVTANYKNFSLTYFYNTIDDMINWYDPDGWMGPIEAYYTNTTGTSIIQGYEVKLQQTLTDELLFNGSYTRLHAADGTGSELPRRVHNTYKGTLDWYPSDALHTGLNAQYIGTRYDNTAKTIQTGQYAVFGGVINYSFNKHIDLYAKFDNVFDRYYQTVNGYATAGRSGYIGMKVNY